MYPIRRLCALCLLMICAACSALSTEPVIISTRPPPPTDVPEAFDQPANIQAGVMIFTQNCASCHGPTGAGDGDLVLAGQVANVPDFTDPAAIENKSLQEWFDVITHGRLEALMPPWRNALSAADRWAVAFYTYTLSYEAASVAEGERLYQANCAACHGQHGEGSAEGGSLVGLLDLTEADLMHFLSVHPAEVDIPPLMTESEQRAVAQYVRLLSTTTRTLPGEVGPLVQPAMTEEVAATAPPVIAQETGTIHGHVIQGTQGGHPPAGLAVTLHILDSQRTEQTIETTAGSDGAYQFDDVPIHPDFAYAVTVDDQNGIRFFSSIFTGDPTITDTPVEVTIYEPTADPTVVEIVSRQFQMNLTPHGVYVIEVINLTNTSSQYVYVRDHEDYGLVSVSFPLAEGLSLEPGFTDMERIRLSDTGRELFDMQPVLPGAQHYIQFSYLLTTTNPTNFSLLPSQYRIDGEIELYVDFNHLSLRGDGIEFTRTEDFDGDVYRVYTVTNAPQPGQIASFQVATVQRQGPPFDEPNLGLVLAGLLVFGGTGLMIAAVLINWQQRRQSTTADHLTQDELIAQIARLDTQFSEGKIDATTYEKQRSSSKTKLALKMKQDGLTQTED